MLERLHQSGGSVRLCALLSLAASRPSSLWEVEDSSLWPRLCSSSPVVALVRLCSGSPVALE